MTDAPLTSERILDAAEDVLRRYGPEKTTVVDVARTLDVSHGTIYRHFPTKAALRDAVTARWLHRIAAPLSTIPQEDAPATARLRRWLDSLIATKRQKMQDDPELFTTYHTLAEAARAVVYAHVSELIAQLTAIIADGASRGEFAVTNAYEAAQAVFDATTRFHHPAHASEWSDPTIDTDFAHVWELVLSGLVHGKISADPTPPAANQE